MSIAAFGQPEKPETQVSLYGIQSLDHGQTLRAPVQNQLFSDREIIPRIRVRLVFDFFEIGATDANRLQPVRRVTRNKTIFRKE